MELIRLENIKFRYTSGMKVLDGLDFSMSEGDRVVLLGGNGAGKTTLLHIILGILRPDHGSVVIYGKKCESEEDFRYARRHIGLLFQDPDDQLFSPSVLEDVAFGPLNLGFSHQEAKKRAENTLDRLGILHLRDRVPYQLSGGEKRLVALATILSMEPDVLLLDEPTAGLDSEMTMRLVDVLNDVPAKGLLIITHQMESLSPVVNKKLRLSKGKLGPA